MDISEDIERRIQALEMRCFRKLPGISYRDHTTKEEVKTRIGNAIGPYEDLLISVKRRKLKWYGHARHTTIWTGQDYPTGNSSRRETKRQTEETMGRRHQRVDRPRMEYHTTGCTSPLEMMFTGTKKAEKNSYQD